MQSSLLREAPGSPEQLQQRLDQLSATSRQATQHMSDVVRGLHQPQQTLPELLERMSDHAHEVLYPLGIEVDFEASPAVTAAPLAPEALQSLYLIYKEALHNVVKHARATRVTVRLSYSTAGLRLTVADNGQGHDGSARPTGNGLRNMQARAQAVGGTVQYEALAPGFAVVAILPETV
jgi:signal transduction histidine kinase